jgi:hypothetical protein
MAEDPNADHDDDDGPPRGPLIMLVVLVVLVAGTMFVMHRINQASAIQDCAAAGRTNCAPIEAPTH